MALLENIVIAITKRKLKRALNMGEVREISSEGLR